jgi:hypothetical protein
VSPIYETRNTHTDLHGLGIGVGWFSTISALFLVAGAAATHLTAVYGKDWRVAIDEKKAAEKEGENQV